jgi:hypothetical protein
MLSGWCQRGIVVELPWSCGPLSVRGRSREPCHQYLLVSETVWCIWCPP